MKKTFNILLITMLFCSCEKANLNLTDENIENRLMSMVGEKISAVSNSLKSEGFQKMKIDDQINFVKNKEAYVLKGDNKIVVSAGYQLSDTTKTYKFFDKYHYEFETRVADNYMAEIYATDFSDWGQSYVDSIEVSNNSYIYIYDNPMLFYSTLQTNMNNLIYASENWWNGEKNNGEMWNIQLGERAKTICITYSDFSITK